MTSRIEPVLVTTDRAREVSPLPGRRGGRARRWIVVVALVFGVVYWQGSRRVAFPPAQGSSLAGVVTSEAAADGRLRLGTFNIHGGKGTDGVRDLSRTADCLRGLDLVALNEVHGAPLLGGTDQAEILAGQLGLQWLFAPSEERWWHEQFGNGALAALPVQSWQRTPLESHGAKSLRSQIVLTCDYQGQTLHLLLTHIERSHEPARQAQFQAVAAAFLKLPEPAVLMGDLNTSADEPQMQRLLQAPGVHDPLAEARQGDVPRRIDWILTRGLRGVDGAVIESAASDHPAFWVELELLPQVQTARR